MRKKLKWDCYLIDNHISIYDGVATFPVSETDKSHFKKFKKILKVIRQLKVPLKIDFDNCSKDKLVVVTNEIEKFKEFLVSNSYKFSVLENNSDLSKYSFFKNVIEVNLEELC